MAQISTKYTFALQLLEDLTGQRTDLQPSTTLIICCEREEFLAQILQQIQSLQSHHIGSRSAEIKSSQDSDDDDPDAAPNVDGDSVRHPFLIPALDLLASSQFIKLAFCPSIPALLAYLSVFQPPSTVISPTSAPRPPPCLVIVDLLALHHGTSEFTLQGLSRTLASTASAAFQTKSSLALIEVKDINDQTNPNRGPRLWDVDVPLLNASIKIRQEGVKWAGRSIPIRKFAKRWFTFDSANKPTPSRVASEHRETPNNDDAEMLV
jgi:hypothetical protein